MSNSKLVTYENITNKSNARKYKITRVTIHHNAGIASTKNLTDFLATTTRQVSANYVIGNDGGIGLNVPENRRAWTSSSYWNDHGAVTIEVANSTEAPTWEISDKAMTSLIKLVTDICKRNGIKKLHYDGTPQGSLTLHEMFANTNCPGPYIKSKLGYIQDEVNKGLGVKPQEKPKPSKPKPNKPQVNNAKSYQRPKGTYSEKGRFTNKTTNKDPIIMRQYVPNVNGVHNGTLKYGEYVDYQDVYIGNGYVWVGNGTTWIPTGVAVNGVNKNPWGTFTAQGSKPKPKTEYVHLPKEAVSWNVYPLHKAPVIGNEIASVKPRQFGGLDYKVLGRPQNHVVTIQTRDYGKVNIWVAPETKARFYTK